MEQSKGRRPVRQSSNVICPALRSVIAPRMRSAMNDVSFELDHIFVAVAAKAPELDELLTAGFEEGPPNVHQGQGTACRRLFFENAYLEFIWLQDRLQACGPRIRRTGLAARAGREAGASRIGLALRPQGDVPFVPPVDTWDYRPPYLPDPVAIPVATNSARWEEPLLFFMPFGRRWSAPRLPHPNGVLRITGVSVHVGGHGRFSPHLQWLKESGGARIEVGTSELLEVAFDDGAQDRSVTLSPSAPLVLRW